ncbi:MAG: isopentenyl-diphosphate Delta-isomerase [Flavitalea sp.]
MSAQQVILVNEADEPIGVMDKMEAHRKALLHRAFSIFIFNSRGEMLLQQRADNKYHSPGLWTNACCSHPSPGEETAVAASRRLKEEMGFTTTIEEALSFTYKTTFSNGLTEFEFDHVFTGIYDETIVPDKEEVKDFCFKSVLEISQELDKYPLQYTSWFHIAFPQVKEWAGEKFGLIYEIAQ